MKTKSVLREKSIEFSLAIIEFCRILKSNKTEYVLCNQLLRSGTAIGALIHEAEYGQSKADFVNKLSIALKEANETSYWLGILKHIHRQISPDSQEICQLLEEIIRMLVASINTAKGNMKI